MIFGEKRIGMGFAFAFLLGYCGSVYSLGVLVVNNSKRQVKVNPVYSGSANDFFLLQPYAGQKPQDVIFKKYYKTGIHQLRGLRVKYLDANGQVRCYEYDLSRFGLRGAGEITVELKNADANPCRIAVKGKPMISTVNFEVEGAFVTCK